MQDGLHRIGISTMKRLLNLLLECRGTRSYGSAAMELAYVSSGRIDAYMSMRLSPWDIAGGIVIAQEVGAVATNFKGEATALTRTRYVYRCTAWIA